MDIHSQLALFGLNTNARIIYLHVHSSGQSTVLQIAKATGIKRTTVYRVTETLKEKGFLYEFDENDSKQLAVTPFTVLEEKIKRKEMKIIKMKSALAPILHTLSKTTQSQVDNTKTYKGIGGLKAVIEYLINDINAEEITVFSHNFSILPSLEFALLEEFWEKCSTTGVIVNHHINEEAPTVWTNTDILQKGNYKAIKQAKTPDIFRNSTVIIRNKEIIAIDWSGETIVTQIINVPILSKLIIEISN